MRRKKEQSVPLSKLEAVSRALKGILSHADQGIEFECMCTDCCRDRDILNENPEILRILAPLGK